MALFRAGPDLKGGNDDAAKSRSRGRQANGSLSAATLMSGTGYQLVS